MALDIALAAALAGWLIVWLWRGAPARDLVLWALAVFALVMAGLAFSMGRWQAVPAGGLAALLILLLLVRPRREAKGLPILSGVGLALAALVSLVPMYLMPVPALPKPTGAYAVGVRDVDLVDASRLGVGESGPDEPRKLFVRIWYPASPAAGSKPRAYATRAETETVFAGLSASFGMPGFFFSHLPMIATHSHENAPLANNRPGPLPVVLFSHGYGSYASQNTVLMEELASHGYIVFSIAHTWDSPAVRFADGSVARASPPAQVGDGGAAPIPEGMRKLFTGRTEDERFAGLIENAADNARDPNSIMQKSGATWVADRRFVLGTLAEGDVPASINDLVAASDFSRVAQTGMSFGGSTSGALCYSGDPCAAGINLDGGDFHLAPLNAAPDAPFLMLHSDWRDLPRSIGLDQDGDPERAFNDFSYESFAEAGATPGVYRLRVNHLMHIGISDYGLFLRQPVRGMLAGDIEGAKLAKILNTFVLGFLDHHMRGIDNGFPDTAFAAFPGDVDRHDASLVRQWWMSKTPEKQQTITEETDRVAGRPTQPAPPPPDPTTLPIVAP